MKTSKIGLDLIRESEGLSLKPYKDPVGLLTIGIGHLIKPGEQFPVSGITEEEAYKLLEQDVSGVETYLNDYLTFHKWTLNQNQFDALVDFGYNLGVASLKTLLGHGLEQVPVQILRWDKAGDKVLSGLVSRREKEKTLWEKPDGNV